MSFCQKHWDDLKAGVQQRGMWALVAPSGQAAIYRIKQELEGTPTNSTYDPLMAAHWMIMNAVLQQGGLDVINRCPLCVVEEHGGDAMVAEWVKGCLDSVLEYVKENKLLDAIQPDEDGRTAKGGEQ